jgi:hypothetical protein
VLATQSSQTYLADRTGNITAAVYDVATGTTVEYHLGDAQETASLVEVDILATGLRESRASHRRLTIAPAELSQEMIEDSKDIAADDL